MHVLAIDPGTDQSAACLYSTLDDKPLRAWKCCNNELLHFVRNEYLPTETRLVIEMVASYGMPVGAEVFDTVRWIGRFEQAAIERGEFAALPYTLKRAEIKMHLCHATAKVNDAVIRQALIDRFGPGKDKAVGTKKNPGILYGYKSDCWAALALAVTFSDKVAAKVVAF